MGFCPEVICRGGTEDIISYFTLMSSEIHYYDIIEKMGSWTLMSSGDRSVRLFEIFRSETSAEAPQDSEFLSLLRISEFFGFQWQNLTEILRLLPKVLRSENKAVIMITGPLYNICLQQM